MLRTKIELYPRGSEEGKKIIADILIANVGKDNVGYTYVYMFKYDDGNIGTGKVYNHAREDGVFKLMQRVCEMIVMNTVHHFFTEYELRVLDQMEKKLLA